MNRATQPQSPNGPWRAADIALLLLSLVVLCAGLWLTRRIDANWDEFHFLSHIFLAREGALSNPLNTFHVHLFGWLGAVGEHALDRINAARLVMWGLLGGSAVLMYATARHFQSRQAALFSVLSVLSFSFVIEHGASFRYDPIAVFLALLAAWLYLRGSVAEVIIAGVTLAIATLVTIKSVLLFPAIGGLLGWQLVRRRQPGRLGTEFGRAMLLGCTALVSALVLFQAHKAGLHVPATARIGGQMSGAADRMFFEPALLPRLDYLVRSVSENPVFYLAFAAGLMVLVTRILWAPAHHRLQSLCLLLLATPVLAILYYRNAYPYYYVFALPFAAMLCGIALDSLTRKHSPGRYLTPRRRLIAALIALMVTMVFQNMDMPYFGVILLALPLLAMDELMERFSDHGRKRFSTIVLVLAVAAMLASTVDTLLAHGHRGQHDQRRLFEAVNAIFPEPGAYIDCCSMISDNRKVGFFMSTWGMDSYRDRGQPIFREQLLRHQPRFVLNNHMALDLDLPLRYPLGLFDEDIDILQDNFIHHWGPIWVAGKHLQLATDDAKSFEILIAGEYVLEADQPVRFGEVTVEAGETIALALGTHRVSSDRNQTVYLRLASANPIDMPEPDGPILRGFGRPRRASELSGNAAD